MFVVSESGFAAEAEPQTAAQADSRIRETEIRVEFLERRLVAMSREYQVLLGVLADMVPDEEERRRLMTRKRTECEQAAG